MSFDWTHYLHLAHELFGKSKKRANREAKLRTAISRAYYGAFIKARNHLILVDKHPIPYGVNPHEYVQSQFSRSRNSLRRNIGNDLHELRRYRNDADYRNVFPASLEIVADEALILADRIDTALKRL